MKTRHDLCLSFSRRDIYDRAATATSCGIAVSARNRFTETGFLTADMAEILGCRTDHQDNPFVPAGAGRGAGCS